MHRSVPCRVCVTDTVVSKCERFYICVCVCVYTASRIWTLLYQSRVCVCIYIVCMCIFYHSTFLNM